MAKRKTIKKRYQRKKQILIEAIILIALIPIISILVINYYRGGYNDANICGDGVCGLSEDCNNCVKDCVCEVGKYCSSIGICKIEVCGNGVCSKDEKLSDSCCEDCGCKENEICNKVTQKCQIKSTISEEDVRNITSNYLQENNIEGQIINIIDAYYKEQTIKQVSIDCGTSEIPYPCQITLFIDDFGKILEEMKTS